MHVATVDDRKRNLASTENAALVAFKLARLVMKLLSVGVKLMQHNVEEKKKIHVCLIRQ